MGGGYFLLGLFARGIQYGMTKLTIQMPRFTTSVNEVMKCQCKCHGVESPQWNTLAIGQTAGSHLHKDSRNRSQTMNHTFSLGEHRGGGLWTESPNGDEAQGKDVNSLQNQRHSLQGDPIQHNMLAWVECLVGTETGCASFYL